MFNVQTAKGNAVRISWFNGSDSHVSKVAQRRALLILRWVIVAGSTPVAKNLYPSNQHFCDLL